MVKKDDLAAAAERTKAKAAKEALQVDLLVAQAKAAHNLPKFNPNNQFKE